MVSGHGIAEDSQHARATDFGNRAGQCGEIIEEWRTRDVSRFRPVIDRAHGAGSLLPEFAGPGFDLVIVLAENDRIHREGHQGLHLFGGWPDVAQPDVTPGTAADRFGHQVAPDVARQRIGHHKRRRREKVCLQAWVDAGFEIAIAREYCGTDEIVVGNRAVVFRRNVAGVADACRAAIGRDAEPEFFQRGEQSRLAQVFGDHPRTRRERGFDMVRYLQPGLNGFFGEQAGRQHDTRVRRIRARSDGGNEDVAIAQNAVGRRDEVAIELVCRLVESVFRNRLREEVCEGRFHRSDFDPVLRALRSRE